MISTNKPAEWEPLGGSDQERPVEKEKEPYRLAGSAEPCPRAATVLSAADHVPTVLIVEDDEPTRTAMAACLAREGYLVLTAADGHEAAGHLERPLEPIDVAILDVGLPDVDGIALCQRLRELYPTMPVVVCSGHAAPAEVAEFLELGASRYFRKPVEPDELLAAVESLLP
jgi:DNA-binding response OmpR family regulator